MFISAEKHHPEGLLTLDNSQLASNCYSVKVIRSHLRFELSISSIFQL